MIRFALGLGMNYHAILWEVPYAVIIQLMHANMASNGIETRWGTSQGDTAPNIEEIRKRNFKFEWQ